MYIYICIYIYIIVLCVCVSSYCVGFQAKKASCPVSSHPTTTFSPGLWHASFKVCPTPRAKDMQSLPQISQVRPFEALISDGRNIWKRLGHEENHWPWWHLGRPLERSKELQVRKMTGPLPSKREITQLFPGTNGFSLETSWNLKRVFLPLPMPATWIQYDPSPAFCCKRSCCANAPFMAPITKPNLCWLMPRPCWDGDALRLSLFQ